MKRKIYILTSSFTIKKKNIEKYFSKKKYSINIECKGSKYSEKEIVEKFSDAYAIIAGTEKYSAYVLNNLKSLKYISRCGVGIDSIDLKELKKNRIKLLTTKNSHIEIVAEHAVAGALSLVKKLKYFNENFKKKIWIKNYVDTLYNKNIGFYGFGKIAKQIRKILIIFTSNFFIYDPLKLKKISYGIKCKSLKSLYKKSDILFICASINKNKYSLNKSILNSDKKKKIIINTSRGELINDKELINYLKKNKGSSYFSDVFNFEPYFGPLIKISNTMFTPHVATYEPNFRKLMENEALNNLSKKLK